MFSVVIPTCDRPEHLYRAVVSVLSQTVQPLEILVVDNGVRDCLIGGLSDRVIPLCAPPRIGASSARNLGASRVNSEWIAFLDDDDVWDSHYLEQMKERIETSSGSYCFVGGMHRLSSNEMIEGKNSEDLSLTRRYLRNNPGVGGSNLVIFKDTFHELGGFDPGLTACEDSDLAIRIISLGFSIKRVAEAIVYVGQDDELQRLTDAKRLLPARRKFIKKHVNSRVLRLLLIKEYELRRYRFFTIKRIRNFRLGGL